MDDRVINGGWGEYQRLVLAELERHNKLLDSLATQLISIERGIEIAKIENKRIVQLVEDCNTRLGKLEEGEIVDNAVKKYRNWIVGIIFAFVASIIVPLIKIIGGF